MMMYAALNTKKILINAIECQNDDQYFCPTCCLPVKLVSAEEKPYFKHQSKSFNHINERDIHRMGKEKLFFAWQNFTGRLVEMEIYLPTIDQRPDILVGKKLAIEYQCALINVNKLNQRVKSYQMKRIDNLWILGGDYLSSTINRLHLKFIAYRPDWGFHLLMFDAKNDLLTLFFEIRFVGPFNKIIFRRKKFLY
ncbi:competence protein [Companilactobacillus versmoldensis DSM 14857 = KCTC 3814]|uniref:Competence protein n=2 Tax=Companilactobacillus versmoldensis TaxID=194326 RepID=A0A0R1SB17_9LACO|nr:competence protein [Companilactobacillus versmoldensis DSM 14857 = KCTC 3814]